LGGLILGAVTGAALVWMLRRERETSKQRTAAAEA
jgi:NhaP-type Na+/H+ or K+/H+ antiporter